MPKHPESNKGSTLQTCATWDENIIIFSDYFVSVNFALLISTPFNPGQIALYQSFITQLQKIILQS